MIKIFIKNSYILYLITKETNFALKLIKKDLKNSVFFYFDYLFFKKLIKKKLISVFVVKKKE